MTVHPATITQFSYADIWLESEYTTHKEKSGRAQLYGFVDVVSGKIVCI